MGWSEVAFKRQCTHEGTSELHLLILLFVFASVAGLQVGVDAVVAQGTEAGGHTGDIATLPLIPQCVDLCKGHLSPLTGKPVAVIGAGSV